MAKRRSWSTGARIASGLGQAGEQIFAQLMRDQMAQRANDRMVARQEASDARTLTRQSQLANDAATRSARQDAINDLPDLIDKLGPDAAYARLAMNPPPSQYAEDFVGTGEQQREREGVAATNAALVNAMRPPMRRRLQDKVGAGIDSAKTVEDVPDIPRVISQSLAADERSAEGPSDPTGLVDMNDPTFKLLGMAPEVADLANQAMDKRNAMQAQRGEYMNVKNPDDSTTRRFVPQDEARKGVQTEQDVVTQGMNLGTKAGLQKVGELKAAGPLMTKQAGDEAYARDSAGIRAKLDHADELIDFDTKQALAKMSLIPQEVDAREYAKSIADARDAAAKSMPVITQIQSLYVKARPLIDKMNMLPKGMGGGLEAGLREDQQPRSTMPQPVKDYLDAVDMARPLLARAFGQTGNPALMEQEWAKYVPNFSDSDQASLLKLARLEALSSSGVQIAQLVKERGAALRAEDIDGIIAPRLQVAYEGLMRMRDEAQGRASGVQPGALPNLKGAGIVVGPNGRLRVGGGQ